MRPNERTFRFANEFGAHFAWTLNQVERQNDPLYEIPNDRAVKSRELVERAEDN